MASALDTAAAFRHNVHHKLLYRIPVLSDYLLT
jgi:hypothetical protein